MLLSRSALTALFLAGATTAVAEVPVVVTDFGPTNAIVGRVMQGLGKPVALLLPNDTPHSFALRPSHAKLLTDAEVVFWMGPEMTPWLAGPMTQLTTNATTQALLETEGWTSLPIRESGHSHATDGEGEGHDPHAWLDPDIAAVWAMSVAETLSAVDPANSVIYQANANQFWADIALLGQEIDAIVADIDSDSILLPHDSMQYFEARFAMAPAGFIAEGDAADPGPAHLRDLRDKILAREITCVLTDVETNPGTIDILIEGTDTSTGILDLTDRTSLGYIGMMQSIAASLAECPG